MVEDITASPASELELSGGRDRRRSSDLTLFRSDWSSSGVVRLSRRNHRSPW